MSAINRAIENPPFVTNSRTDYSAYDPSYRLLKEAQESWQYAISDKLVYNLQPLEIALDSLVGVAKHYVNGTDWIEAHVTFEVKGDTYHACIVILVDEGHKLFRNIGKIHDRDVLVGRDSPMLVDVAQFVESPKQVPASGCGILSRIWLKLLDNGNCVCGYPFVKSTSVDLPVVGGIERIVQNRELSPFRIGSVQVSERPDQLVEGSAKTRNNVTDNQGKFLGNVFDLKADDIPHIFKIIFTDKRYRIVLSKNPKALPQVIKVFFRPSGFQIGIGQLSHS